jgi:hypothetical protein
MSSVRETAIGYGPLVGWWELVSCEVQFQASGSRAPMYDAPARGLIVFGQDGRVMTVIEVEQDTPRPDHLHRLPASRGMAYTGRYRVDGDRWLTEVDAALIEGWTGSIQERWFRVEADCLHVCSAWCVSPLHADQVVRAWLQWKRPLQQGA